MSPRPGSASDFNCLAFQHNWHSSYTLYKLTTIPAMSDVMPVMYLQQSNEKVFVKTYTTDWLADKGNSKINIIESLLYFSRSGRCCGGSDGRAPSQMMSGETHRFEIFCRDCHPDTLCITRYALLIILERLKDCPVFPHCPQPKLQVSYLTLSLLMECDFADVDSDTSKTDETLAGFDLTTS